MRNYKLLSMLVWTAVVGLSCGGRGGDIGFRVGGNVSGLAGTLVLQNNLGDDLTLHEDGPFYFQDRLEEGAAYAVTVLTQPPGQLCSLAQAQGVVQDADVTSVVVTCADESNTHTVGGAVTGLSGMVVLQNNGGDDLSVTADGAFTFATPLADNSPYEVRVVTQPAGQTCFVDNGAGDIAGADVTDVVVGCHYPGDPDESFGVAGLASHEAGSDSGTTMALHPDGRFILAGAYHPVSGSQDMLLRAFTEDGELDTSFGDAGLVGFDNPDGQDCNEDAHAVTIDGEGRIVAVGYTACGGVGMLALWRYLPDGSADTSLDGDGFATWTVAGHEFYGYAVAIDGSGRILVTGETLDSGNERDIPVWRFHEDGTPDDTFGVGGYVSFGGVAGGAGWDQGAGIFATPDGKILVTGDSDADVQPPPTTLDMVLLRLEDDGTLDPTFGQGGVVSHNSAAGGDGWDHGIAVTMDTQGRILVVGDSTRDNVVGVGSLVIWRYNADGTLDSTFGTGGVALHYGAAGGDGSDAGRAIVLDAAGRILVTGVSDADPDAGFIDLAMATWRFNSDGTLDTTFGQGGFVSYNGVSDVFSWDEGNSIFIDPLGRIVVGGWVSNGSNSDGAVWRFFP